MSLACLLLGLVGCRGAVPSAAPVAQAELQPRKGPAVIAPTPEGDGDAAPPARAGAPVQFEVLERPRASEPVPHVEVLFPRFEQRIAVGAAPAYPVKLRFENWRPAPNRAVELTLDEHRPRRWDLNDKPLTLAELLPDDREIEAGQHRLVAVLVEDGYRVQPEKARSRAPFAAVQFWVGEPGEPRFDLDQPMLVHLQPRGTYNGQRAADSIAVDFLALSARLGEAAGEHRIKLEVEGPSGRHSTWLSSPAPVRLKGLASGDHRVRLTLFGADAAVPGPFAAVERWITVNRDAPVAEASAAAPDAPEPAPARPAPDQAARP